MEFHKRMQLQTILAAFPVPENYIVLDVLTAGFVAAKHMILAYAKLGEPTQRLGWHRHDYTRPEAMPKTVELEKLTEKVAAQRDAYINQGNVYNLPDEFLYDVASSVEPKKAASDLFDLFQQAVWSLDTPNPVAIVSHNISCFATPFITNLLNWHGYDGSIVGSVWQYDTAVITRAVTANISPMQGERWDEFSNRVAAKRITDKWSLASCRQEYQWSLDDQVDVLQNNVQLVDKLLQYYKQCAQLEVSIR